MAETRNIETSLTLDYRKNVWGIERIVLDTVSNHLPSDSSGSMISIWLKQGGEYIDFHEADFDKPTEEVIFEDNGSGYDAGLLSVLYSPKSADALSIGQFGEGLKLVAAAALRNRLSLEYRSRNWRAIPYKKIEVIDHYQLARLCFEVILNGDQLEGSRTVFSNPSPEFLQELRKLPEKVLALNNTYRELHNELNNYSNNQGFETHFTPQHAVLFGMKKPRKSTKYNSRIIDIGVVNDAYPINSLFVKGVCIKGISSIFSYDLGLENVSPDRIHLDHEDFLKEIESLLKGCTNSEVIEAVLKKANENPQSGYDEFNAFNPSKLRSDNFGAQTGFSGFCRDPYGDQFGLHNSEATRNKKKIDVFKDLNEKFHDLNNPWVLAFKRLYGENAVLASKDINKNKDAESMDYKPVILNDFVGNYLHSLGIMSADEIDLDQEYRWVGLEDLTQAEHNILARVPDITKIILGYELPVEVRIFTGLFTSSGREIENVPGVQTMQHDGTKYIGAKRSILASFPEFANTYVHELGHYVTGAGDFERKFVDFHVDALTKLMLYLMEQQKQ